MERNNAGEAIESQEKNSTRWKHYTIILIGGLFALRLTFLATAPIDLVHDEAYYWDWSRDLDLCYYSKPPMVACLIALSTSIGGANEFSVRLPAVCLGTFGLVFAYLLTTQIYSRKAGFLVTMIVALTPGNVALSFLMTIDAPFLFFWSATLYFFWRMINSESQSGKWCLLATVSAGFGLLTKQTMIAFFPLAFLYLATCPQLRSQLKRPWIWIWAAGTMAFLTPVILWNSQHDWITLTKTESHFASESDSVIRRLFVSAEFVLAQFGIYSPATFAVFILASVAALFGWKNLGSKERFLFCFSALPLMGVLLLSVKQRVLPNWPAPFCATGIILATAWALKCFSLPGRIQAKPYHFRRMALFGLASVVLTYIGTLCLPMLGLEGSKIDFLVRLRGWRQLGQQTTEQIVKHEGVVPENIIVTTSRAEASALAFYMESHPQVIVWNDSGIIGTQYDLWNRDDHYPKVEQAIIVTKSDQRVPKRLASSFGEIRYLEQVVVPIGENREHRLDLYRARKSDPIRFAETLANPTTQRR